jgi:Ni/Fe-hydrogenase subunit HybB-like protein
MILDVWFLGLTVVFGILLILGLSGNKEGLTRLSRIVLPIVTILLPLGTAWLFTTLPGKVGWSSSLEIGVFIAQAALAGLCVLFILQGIAKNVANITSKLVLAFLLINLALIIGEVGQALYSSGIEALPTKALLRGGFAPIFWCQVILGVIIPSILLAMNKSPLIAGVLSLLGVVITKYLFVVKGNIYPFLNIGESLVVPELGAGNEGYLMAPTYVPSGFEWLVGIGVFALGVLLINLLLPRVTNKQVGVINIIQDINWC